jgi:hypothetical protein
MLSKILLKYSEKSNFRLFYFYTEKFYFYTKKLNLSKTVFSTVNFFAFLEWAK